MANLNFQQPPRSIANASLSNRSASGFGGASLSGHVTPTSGMFPQSNANYAPSQLSPNRNVQLSGNNSGVGPPQIASSGRSSIFGQRAFSDRRPMQGLGPMVKSEFQKFSLSRWFIEFLFFFLVFDGIVYAV